MSRHCTLLDEDRLDFLKRSNKEEFMTFLKWILDVNDRIRKRRSVHEYWRVLRMLYRKSVGESIRANMIEEVNNVRVHRLLLESTTKPKIVHRWVPDLEVRA
jgi:hypothetical protein